MKGNTYKDYQEYIKEDVSDILSKMKCQPILFIGSGFSQRYIKTPNWIGLLTEIKKKCPLIEKAVDYYVQDKKNLIEVGSIYANFYKEWAWSGGKDEFPEDLFDAKHNSDIYIKYAVCDFFKNNLTDNWLNELDDSLKKEIDTIRKIAPHAIITTNYDGLTNEIFKDFQEIVGQNILRANPFSIGDIFKIHGSIDDPSSLILTSDDYHEFQKKKKYLSAKLLTFFAEHPLLFVGYSATDPNITSILSDIDEIISVDNEIIPNIYILQYEEKIEEHSYPVTEKLIPVNESRSIRLKTIVSSEFNWVFEAFINLEAIEPINPKILRTLLSRTYDLVRCDIPRRKFPVNYEVLQRAVESDDGLAKLYGITMIDDPSKLNAAYPYTLSSVAEELGYGKKQWHHANKLIEKIKQEHEIDIKGSDNNYHLNINNGSVRLYSQDAIDLLRKVKDGQEYISTISI